MFKPFAQSATLSAPLSVLLLHAAILPPRPAPSKPAETLAALPVGLYLPVVIPHALHAGKTKPGTEIVAHLAQRVPIAADSYMPAADLLGEVTASTPAQNGHGPVLTIRFTQLRYRGALIPLRAMALAVANYNDVTDAGVLAAGSTDRSNSNPANWTTMQVGGEEVYRSGWQGPLCGAGLRVVGSADYHGVYTLPQKLNAEDETTIPLALGAFSSVARGLYGFDDGSALTGGNGDIVITGSGKDLVVRAGDELLLKVIRLP